MLNEMSPQELITLNVFFFISQSFNLINPSFTNMLQKWGLANHPCICSVAWTCLLLWLKLKCFLPHNETENTFISLKRPSICKISYLFYICFPFYKIHIAHLIDSFSILAESEVYIYLINLINLFNLVSLKFAEY